jgi:hypothetical protein
MTLKIDGYVAPSTDTALGQGVTFVYPTPYGEISIRSKLAGRTNTKYRLAMTTFTEWQQRRKNLNKGGSDDEADERLIGIIHDHLVIDWSTTIKSDGKEIAPTRENFIALLSSDACSQVLPVYLQDASDESYFRPQAVEEDAAFLQQPSDGNSDGRPKRNG